LILDKIRPAAGGEWPDGVLDAFYIALKYKNADCALAFLKCDFDVLAPLPNGSNAFEFALQLGISPVIHEMLSLRPDLWQSTDFESVFQDSVENLSGFKRNYNTLNALIDLSQTGKLSLDFSSQDGTYHNYTPLHRIVAATRGIYDSEQPGIQCLQNLVGKAGADLTKVSHTGQTPLHLALRMSKVGFTKVLLRACITRAPDVIYMYDQQGHTPLHLAAMMTTGKGDMIAELIDAGADILACDARGESPLHLAARCPNNKENIDKLLEAGADIEGPNTLSLTPLQIAASVRDNTETIDALLAAGANSKATTTAGETPLHLAASISENAKVVERLLDAGADLSLRDSKGRTALHNAAGACVHVTRVLAGRVADIRALDNEGMPPQHISAVAGGGPGLRFWRFYDDGKGRWHQDCHVCGAEPLVEGDRDSDDDVGFELFDWY
jgi:ankyrin repeat protein